MCAPFLLIAAAGIPAWAAPNTWDTSGNSLLNGAYYFRNIVYVVGNSAGDLAQSNALYGTVTFDGSGGYAISNATVNSCNVTTGCSQQTGFSITGNYWIASNGYGFFTSPVSTSINIYRIYGFVTNGIVIGSSTEDGYNSIFIATPVGIPPTASSFQGTYQLYDFVPPQVGENTTAKDFSFILNPDGAGNIGTVNMTGYVAGGGSSAVTQTSPGVTYTFTNGAGTVQFPTDPTAPFFSGDLLLYMSPDHNFVFGGSATELGMFVGVKPTTGSVSFSNLYYMVGIDEDTSQLDSEGFSALVTFYGSFNAKNGTEYVHKRSFNALGNPVPYAYTYNSYYPVPISNGTYIDPINQRQFTFGNGGAIRVGWAISGTTMGIRVALKAPTMSGSGVYLNPNGVINAATFSPFTQGISPGETIILYGTGLSSGNATASSLPLPTTLGNVQVMINGIPAPLFYVTPTQLSAVVPFGIYYTPTPGVPAIPNRPIATIQVLNDGIASNTVTYFINHTSVGAYSLDGSGTGYSAIAHALTGQVVNASNPAQPGEDVSLFLAGLGDTSPAATNGAAPTGLSNTVDPISVTVGSLPATVTFAGLAPTLAGVYQVNLIIPLPTTAGDNLLEVRGPDSDNYQQALIAVGGGTGSAITGGQPRVQSITGHRATRAVTTLPLPQPCLTTNPACGGIR